MEEWLSQLLLSYYLCRYCYKVITAIPDMVNKLPKHLENLEWEQGHSTQDTIALVVRHSPSVQGVVFCACTDHIALQDSRANDMTESLSTCEDLTVKYRQVGSCPL